MKARALDVQVLAGFSALASLEPEWWGLFERAPTASPFQSPAWLLPWAECFADEGAIRTIVVTTDRELVGIFPIVLSDVRGRLVAFALGHGLSDYLDALVDSDALAGVSRALSEGLRRLARDVDSLELSDVPDGSPLLTLEPSLAPRCARCAVCPRVVLGATFAEYVATLPRWLARNLRQGAARLARAGATYAIADDSSLSRSLEAFFELHGARARHRRKGEGVLASPVVRAFHRRTAPRLLARGLLELHTALIEERPIASAYVLVRRDAYLYLTGFDPAFERSSAGTVLIGRTIARAIEERRQAYDFLRGAEAYKYSWGAKDTMTTQLTLAAARVSRPEQRP